MDDFNDLRVFTRAILAHKLLILASVLLVSVTTFVTSTNQEPVYEASSILMLRQKDMGTSVIFGNLINQFGGQAERSLQDQATLMTARPSLEKVIDKLKLKQKPDELATQIDVQVERTSNVMTVNVLSDSPYRAQAIADVLVATHLAETQKSSINELSRAAEQVNIKLKDAEDEIIALAKETANYRAEAPDDLQAKLDLAVNLYVMMAEKHEQLNIAKELRTSDVQLVSSAVALEEPISPKPLRNTVLAVFAGLAVGLMFSLGLEQLSNKIRTAEEVEKAYGLPLIGMIPFDPKMAKRSEIIVRRGSTSTTAEAYRIVRTNLEFFSAGQPIKTLLVTSAGPGEGKSSFSINLGAAFAHTGLNIIVVSADMRRPTIGDFVEKPHDNGLSAYLGGYIEDIGRIIVDSPVEKLNLVPGGKLPPNPAELLGSDRMAELMDALRERADIVIIDTPPILSVADARVVSRYGDAVVVISDHSSTTKEDGQKVRATLSNTDIRQLGVVLNKVPPKELGSYGYYGQEDRSITRAKAPKNNPKAVV